MAEIVYPIIPWMFFKPRNDDSGDLMKHRTADVCKLAPTLGHTLLRTRNISFLNEPVQDQPNPANFPPGKRFRICCAAIKKPSELGGMSLRPLGLSADVVHFSQL